MNERDVALQLALVSLQLSMARTRLALSDARRSLQRMHEAQAVAPASGAWVEV